MKSLIFVLLLFLVSGTVVGSELQLALAEQSISLTGLGPFAKALVFGGGADFSRLVPRLVFEHVMLTGDQSGNAVYIPRAPLPANSVWFAVELETGAWVSALAAETLERKLPADSVDVRSGANELVVRGHGLPSLVYAMVVRPGVGAWFIYSSDGSSLDRDGAWNAQQLLHCGDFQRVNGTETFDRFFGGDILFLIDLRRHSFLVFKVGEQQ